MLSVDDIEFRAADPKDSEAISVLLTELGYPASAAQVVTRMSDLGRAGAVAIVAAHHENLIGLVTVQTNTVLHRSADDARITSLVVTQKWRGKGFGKRLVGEAEQWARKRGCQRVEVTCGNARTDSHHFYLAVGYEHTSLRFSRELV